ncbi:Trypsin [Oryctes borbonicus]|uniref:Phenoloxidase-activating factor 2 n=1 Tax=Oryctes borbonicus TaxID=1629725 RepID=A0A0T6BH70_9SCAR|nr:Trypsin [Oryctes borbonicus]
MAKPEDSKTQAQRWPWIAALYFKDVTYEQFCGGSLITDRHVLTASHCLEGLKASDIRVRLGEYDFTKTNETRSQDFSISEIIMHEDYSTLTYENDVAIVKLSKPTIFNSYIWPVCLPPTNDKFEGKTAVVAGWGQIRYQGYTSELLLEATIPIWYQKECVAAFAQRITDNMICAAAYEGGVDSCKGDSGGPLLHQLDNERWVVIGIVSWGIGCGNKGKPGLYTRVNNYIPWIIKHTTPKYNSAYI